MISLNNSSKRFFLSTINNFDFLNQFKNINSLLVTKNIFSISSNKKLNLKYSLSGSRLYQNNVYSFSNNNIVKQAFNQIINHKYSRLCRWDKPIGALLLFWPCLWGIQAGAHGLIMTQSKIFYLTFKALFHFMLSF